MSKIININDFEKGENNPFVTPDNYFEELLEKIINRCKPEIKKSKNVFLFNKPILKYAASVLVIVGISFMALYLGNGKRRNYTENFADNFSDSILYIANMHEINETNMIDYLAENTTNDNTLKYTNDDIIEYIDANTNSDNEILELMK